MTTTAIAPVTTDPTAPEIFRTPKHGCFSEHSSYWGSYLAPAIDPLADGDIPEADLKKFHLREGIRKIPKPLWTAWVELCFHFVRQGNRQLEVSCRLLRNETDPSEYRIIIPPQEVSAASVDVPCFDGSIDIMTGEVIESYPPIGWRPIGSSHSHNTMDVFFSSTDDRAELGDPGLHIVVGRINLQANNYAMKCSITAHKRRFEIDMRDIIDLDGDAQGATYHPSVLKNVVLHSYALPGMALATAQPTAAGKPARRKPKGGALVPPGRGARSPMDEDLAGYQGSWYDDQASVYQITDAIADLLTTGDQFAIHDLISALEQSLETARAMSVDFCYG
jgi:hypothetical protein